MNSYFNELLCWYLVENSVEPREGTVMNSYLSRKSYWHHAQGPRGGGGEGGEGLVGIYSPTTFLLGRFFRAPDGMDNFTTCLLLHTRFTKSKARQSCAAAVILTGVPTV